MLVFIPDNRSDASKCYTEIELIKKEQDLYKIINEQEQYKFEKILKKASFDLTFVGKSNEKQHRIRLINSVRVEKDHIKDVLKEAIVFTRINCDQMIQNYIRYFITNKHLFLVMSHIDVSGFF